MTNKTNATTIRTTPVAWTGRSPNKMSDTTNATSPARPGSRSPGCRTSNTTPAIPMTKSTNARLGFTSLATLVRWAIRGGPQPGAHDAASAPPRLTTTLAAYRRTWRRGRGRPCLGPGSDSRPASRRPTGAEPPGRTDGRRRAPGCRIPPSPGPAAPPGWPLEAPTAQVTVGAQLTLRPAWPVARRDGTAPRAPGGAAVGT